MKDQNLINLINLILLSDCVVENKIWALSMQVFDPKDNRIIYITTLNNEIEFFDSMRNILGEVNTEILASEIQSGTHYLMFLPSEKEAARESRYNKQ